MFVVSAWAAAPSPPGQLPDDVSPTAELVALNLDPARAGYDGLAHLSLEVHHKTDRFTLHAEGLELGDVVLQVGRKALPMRCEQDGSRLTLVSPKRLRPGPALLTIPFAGTFGTDVGLYKAHDEDQDYVLTQLEADEARTAWPAFDEPRYKIPWTLVVQAPASQTVLSNTAPATRVVDEQGNQHVTFATTAPLSSYLVALAVGPFTSVPLPGGRAGAVWALPGHEADSEALAALIPAHLSFLETWFDRPSPYAKTDLLVVPHFTYGAMENPGLIIGVDRSLFAGPGSTPRERSRSSMVTAHELAHFWFGDLVTMYWWDDLWLNEAFADWLAARAERSLHPELGDQANEVVEAFDSLRSDSVDGARPLRTEIDPDHVFETANVGQAYSKGGAVLDVVEAWLGPDVFQEGLRAYVRDHAEGSVTIDDLLTSLSAVSGKDVGRVVRPYVDEPGAPRLDFTRDAGGRWRVSRGRLQQASSAPNPSAPWVIPVHLRFGSANGEGVTDLLVDADTLELPALDGARWVYPTPDGIGYLGWSQPEDAFRALIEDPAQPLTPIERLALVLDLDLLRDLGSIDLAQELSLFQGLATETDPSVGSALVKPWATVWTFRPSGKDAEVGALLRSALRPTLDAVGMEPRADDTARTPALRAELLSLLGLKARDPEVVDWARRTTESVLREPASVDQSLVDTALRIAAENGDDALHARLVAAHAATADPDLKSALSSAFGAVPTERARAHALGLASGAELPFRERMGVLSSVFPDEAQGDELLAWVEDHYDTLIPTVPEPFRIYLAGVGGGCSKERFARARQFFGAPERHLTGVDHVLERVESEVQTCVEQRQRLEPAIQALLDAR